MKRLCCLMICAILLLSGCITENGNPASDPTQAPTIHKQEPSGSQDVPMIQALQWDRGTFSTIRRASGAPRVFQLSDGTLIAGCETSGRIMTYISKDNGQTWGERANATFYPEFVCANINFCQYGDQLLMAYRAVGYTEQGFFSSLQVSVSTDFGRTWEKHSTVATTLETSGEFHGIWEPYLGMLNGELACFYANDSRLITTQQNIEYRIWKNGRWSNRTIVSNGESHNSRDGMPVWTQLKNGVYVCVIESSKYRKEGNPFVLQLLWSDDGVTWSEPVDIYRPKADGSKAAAPGIVELPNGQIVISFQTDEDVQTKGDQTSVMKTIISDGSDVRSLTAASFSAPESVFGEADGGVSNWSGLYYGNGYLYAAAGTLYGATVNILCIE